MDEDDMVIGPEPDERQLISQLKQGNTTAAGELMDLHGEPLMRYLHSIMGTREAAEDIFQDSWVKVMEKISLFDTDLSFRPWLFRLARNVAYDTLRRKKRWWSLDTGQSVENGDRPMEIPDPTDFGRQVVAQETVKRLLGFLAPVYREVLYLRFFQDQSYEEIAELCRLPLGTVKSRLKRGLDYLAGNMKEEESHG
jgi:RNA polymerase sigma-70 factor (ECF subfamily)